MSMMRTFYLLFFFFFLAFRCQNTLVSDTVCLSYHVVACFSSSRLLLLLRPLIMRPTGSHEHGPSQVCQTTDNTNTQVVYGSSPRCLYFMAMSGRYRFAFQV